MSQKEKNIKELIKKHPNLSANKIYEGFIKGSKTLGIRKTDFLKFVRQVRNKPEPTLRKRKQSIPVKHRKAKPISKVKVKIKPKPKKKIPFEKTRFGRIVKDIQKKNKISEKRAIEHTRKLLKIPKKDYANIRRTDLDVLTQYGY